MVHDEVGAGASTLQRSPSSGRGDEDLPRRARTTSGGAGASGGAHEARSEERSRSADRLSSTVRRGAGASAANQDHETGGEGGGPSRLFDYDDPRTALQRTASSSPAKSTLKNSQLRRRSSDILLSSSAPSQQQPSTSEPSPQHHRADVPAPSGIRLPWRPGIDRKSLFDRAGTSIFAVMSDYESSTFRRRIAIWYRWLVRTKYQRRVVGGWVGVWVAVWAVVIG